MKLISVVSVLLLVCSLLQATLGQDLIYEFIGGGSCEAGGDPCDFDNPDLWQLKQITKRNGEAIQAEPNSPSLQSNPYDIEIPGSFAYTDYILVATNASGYYLRNIYFSPYNPIKRDVKETNDVLTAFTLRFVNTKLHNFKGFEVGDTATIPNSYHHSLVFDNTTISPFDVEGACTLKGYATVSFKGNTVANINCQFDYQTTGNILLVEPTVYMKNSANFFLANGNHGSDNTVKLYGQIELNSYEERTFDNDIYLTGGNITVSNSWTADVRTVAIGESANDNGKTTRLGNKVFVKQLTVGYKSIAIIALRSLVSSSYVGVSDESSLSFEVGDYGESYFFESSVVDVKGNSEVVFNTPLQINWADKKKAAEGLNFDFYFNVYDGLLEFNQRVHITVSAPTFRAHNSTSVITFNDEFARNGFNVFFEFAPGSTITFNKGLDYPNSLPASGVNYIFGAGNVTYPNPELLHVNASGSITLKGTKVEGIPVVIEDSDFGGYGTVTADLTLSGTSKLSLTPVGKTLAVEGKVSIPTGTIISVAVDSNTCAKLVVGTLDMSSSVSFEILLSGAAPTQNTTYVVVEYTTFTGTLPASPNAQLYEVIHDTVNKQIKVKYVHDVPPVAPTNGGPTDTPPTNGEPTNVPPTATNPSGQTGFAFKSIVLNQYLLLISIVMVMSFILGF